MTEPSSIERIRTQPFSVLLSDEIEKAHPLVLDLFLQIFDEARLTGAYGKSAQFTNTIILLTSNLGANLYDGPIGFSGDGAPAPTVDDIRADLEESFRPELVNRIEYIVPFNRLSRGALEQILEIELTSLGSLPGMSGIEKICLSPEVRELVIKDGYKPKFGARPLRRSIDRYVLTPLSYLLTTETVPANTVVGIRPHSAGAAVLDEGAVGDWVPYQMKREKKEGG